MSDHLQKLEELKKLKDGGVLTPDEFEREKSKILAEKDAPKALAKKKGGGCGTAAAVIGGVLLLLFVVSKIVPNDSSNSITRTTPSATTSPSTYVPPPATVLELKKWSWYREYDFITVEGKVTNISGEPLENVEAVVSFSDKNGEFVSSDNALVEYKTLLPNQTTPFKVIAHDNPAIKTAHIEFKQLMGDKLNHRQ